MAKASSPERPADAAPAAGGGDGVRGKRRARRLREIDFSRPTKFTQEQLRRIERAHEGFCRTASMRLSGEARTEIELEVVDLAQLTWTASLADLPASSLHGIVKLDPPGMHMLVSTELVAVRAIVDRMLGSVEAHVAPPEQELTEIELALARRVLDSIVEELSRTWEELLGLTLAVDWVDVQLQSLQLAPPSEPTIALTVQLRLDELTASLSVVVPFRSIEGEVGRLPTGAGDLAALRETDAVAAAALLASLSETWVELRVEVASKELSLAEVLALAPGDVVGLDSPAESGVTLCAEVVPIHRARPGRRGNRRAVEVLERLEAQP
jgi:flagellar motor switch protein FliM